MINRAYFKHLVYFIPLLGFLITACGSGGGGGDEIVPEGDNSTTYYVSDAGGDDAADGLSPTTAKKTINAAIAAARKPAEIRVAEGTYRVTSHAGDPTYPQHITLKDGVSLFGGYSADFSTRDPAVHVTTITNMSTTAVARNIISDTNISRSTLIDGFTLIGGNSTTGIRTVQILTGSPTIRNNVIVGGTTSDSYGIEVRSGSPAITGNHISISRIGISVTDASPEIDGNTIVGGSGSVTHGINVSGTSIATIINNQVSGGSASLSAAGIYFSGGSATVAQNKISAGSSNDAFVGYTAGIYANNTSVIRNNVIYGGNGGANSYGIYGVAGSATVQNNTINGGSGVTAAGLSTDLSTISVFAENNILTTHGGTQRYCVMEEGPVPVEFNNNDLFGCPTAVYYDAGNGCTGNGDGDNNSATCTLAEMEPLIDLSGNASGNVSADPQFVDIAGPDGRTDTLDDNDWHLGAGVAEELREGGLDLSSIFADDFDGAARTAIITGTPSNPNAAGWSMGAYELD